MRSGALLGGGGRLASSSIVPLASSATPLPSTHGAPARRGYAAARASASRSVRDAAVAAQGSSLGAALRARGSAVPAALRASRALSARSSSRRSYSSSSSRLVVKAVFERFTERAIKAVMLSQTEAKTLGSSEVRSLEFFGGLDERGQRGACVHLEFWSALLLRGENSKASKKKREGKKQGLFAPSKNAPPTVHSCSCRSTISSSDCTSAESRFSMHDRAKGVGVRTSAKASESVAPVLFFFAFFAHSFGVN